MARKQINIRAGFDLKAFSTSSQNLERSLKQTAAKMKRIGTTMTASITAPLVAMGGLAVKTFASFEQSMAKVNAVSGATGAEFKALNQLAKDLGATTRFTASEVSDLMLNYSKLGFSAAEIEKITGATLNLALATGEDLAKSAEVAGSTLRAFGLDADQMLRVTDVMAKSFSSSALDLDRFSESMKYVAPVAAAAGISLEEASAMLAVLANNGIKGSQAGTSLRRIISDLGTTSGGTSNAIAKLAKKGLGLDVAMDEVGRTAQTALIVLGKGIEQIEPLTAEFENAAGSAESMAAIMDKTLQGAMFRMKSAAEAAAIEFGQVLSPMIEKATVFFGELATYLKDLDPETKNLIINIVAITAAIGPLVIAIGSLNSALAFLASNPVVLAALAIGGLAYGVVKLIDYLAPASEEVDNLSESSKLLSKTTKEGSDELEAETSVIKSYFDALKKTNKGSKERKDLIDTINKTYKTTLKNLEDEKDFVNQLDESYADLVTSLKTKIHLQIKEDALSDLIKIEEGIRSVINNIDEDLSNFAPTISGATTTDLEGNLLMLGSNVMNEYATMRNELQKQYDLLSENKKAQDVLLSGSFFKDMAENAKSTSGAIGGTTKEIDKATTAIQKRILYLERFIDLLRVDSLKIPFIPVDLKANLNPQELKEELKKAEKSIVEPIMVPIAVDTSFIQLPQKLYDEQAADTARRQATDLGESISEALTDGLKSLATDTVSMLGQFIGDSLTSKSMMNDQLKNTEEYYNDLIKAAKNNSEEIAKLEQEKADKIAEIQKSFTFENRVEDFGRGLLDAIGKFMGQFGEAMVAMGIAQIMLDVAIKSMNPALAIVGGIALIAAGAAISNLSQKGTGITGGSSSSYSGSSGFSSMSGIGANMQPIVLDTRLSGRDMIITQGRESQFRR